MTLEAKLFGAGRKNFLKRRLLNLDFTAAEGTFTLWRHRAGCPNIAAF
jgi:hypothetical protein